MTAYKVGEEHALTFVKVLDEITYGLVDDDEPLAEPTDRLYWESKRGTAKTLTLTDELLKLVNEVEPRAILKYNKHYIGLGVDGAPMNFVTFIPRRGHVIMQIKLPKTTEYDEQIEEGGLETLAYDTQWRQYRLHIDSMLEGKQREVLLALARLSREGFGKPA